MRGKGGWRCFMKDSGGQFVGISGEILKPKLSASNSTSITLAKVIHIPCMLLLGNRSKRNHYNRLWFYLTMQWC